ncbi:MAG TPA: pseudouridine synthase [Mycobacteriales bacterium]|nr:pseudouridine synthase [Mycobacteriales bacterium]
MDDSGLIRLQKVLADAGVGSRRACEELIEQARVEVDGAVVRVQGMRIDPTVAVVKVDGMRVVTAPDRQYLVLNKPRGVVTTMSDDRGRPTVGDLIAARSARLFHVGRLDADTEGLLLLTNDGDLAHRLTHPSHGVPKTYLAEVTGVVPKDALRRLRTGVELEDGPAAVDAVRVSATGQGRTLLELTISEGRNRIVRRLCAAVGHPVVRLVRTQVGPVTLGSLRPGKTRRLTAAEVAALFDAAGD